MAGLEAVVKSIKSQENVMFEMLGVISQQNKTLVSIDAALKKNNLLLKEEAKERARERQDLKRMMSDKGVGPIPENPLDKDKDDEDKKKGSWLDKVLSFFAAGGILSSIIGSTIGGLFGPAGMFAKGWNALTGKDGLFAKGWNGLVGKDGLILKGWNGLVGKDGLFVKGWKNLVKEDGILAKAGQKVGDVGKAIKEGPLDNLLKKFPKLGTLGDDLAKGLGKFGKFAKSIKGGGLLSGLVSGGVKFAETGDTGQAVTQGAGAGAGALAGGALGSLIAPGIGTAIGAAIGGIAGDFLTDELRKMGWLEPIEDSINKVVDVFRGFIDYMSPVFEGFISSFTDTFESLKVTFDLIGKAGQKLTTDIGNVINSIKDTLGGWWDGFQKNIIKPLTNMFGQVVEFLKPVLDPLKELATNIITPLTTAFGMLFDKIKNLPFIGDLLKGPSEDQRRGFGRGIGDFFTGGFNMGNNAFQGLLRSYVPEEKQMGGPITIPGSSFGDSYPMALPPGSFVLNRRASEQYGFQDGGMVPTILEPGEKVFLPGTYGPEIPMLNDMVPRFQSGGEVPSTDKPSTDKKETTEEVIKKHPLLEKLSDEKIKKVDAPPGYCVTGSLDTMKASGVPEPAATGQDVGNNPRGAISQLMQPPFSWKSLGGTTTKLDSPYGSVSPGIHSGSSYDKLVESGKVPSGALVFQTRFNDWNSTSPRSSGYDMAIAQKGGKEHWNGQPMPQRIYGDVKKVVVLTPDGKGGDGSDVKTNAGGLAGLGQRLISWVGGDGGSDRTDGSDSNPDKKEGNFFSRLLGNKAVQQDSGISSFFSQLAGLVPGLGLLLGSFGGGGNKEKETSFEGYSTIDVPKFDPEKDQNKEYKVGDIVMKDGVRKRFDGMGWGDAPQAKFTSPAGEFQSSGKFGPVLDLIRKVEGPYLDSMYPGTRLTGATKMTISQVANKATGAVGAWQNLPRYLVSRSKAVGLDPNTALYNEENQTKIAEYLIGPGQANVSVQMMKEEPKKAMRQLSKVWAAIPKDDSGVSYYAGVGNNKAHIKPSQMYKAFEKLQMGGMVGANAAKMMSPNVTNNVTNKNLREEPKQLGGMVGDKVTKMMSSNSTNNVTKMMSPNVP